LNAEIDNDNRVAMQRTTLRRKAPFLVPAVPWMVVLTLVLCPCLKMSPTHQSVPDILNLQLKQTYDPPLGE